MKKLFAALISISVMLSLLSLGVCAADGVIDFGDLFETAEVTKAVSEPAVTRPVMPQRGFDITDYIPLIIAVVVSVAIFATVAVIAKNSEKILEKNSKKHYRNKK